MDEAEDWIDDVMQSDSFVESLAINAILLGSNGRREILSLTPLLLSFVTCHALYHSTHDRAWMSLALLCAVITVMRIAYFWWRIGIRYIAGKPKISALVSYCLPQFQGVRKWITDNIIENFFRILNSDLVFVMLTSTIPLCLLIASAFVTPATLEDWASSLMPGYLVFLSLLIIYTGWKTARRIIDDRNERLLATQKQLRQVNRDKQIACRMHDHVTNELAYIALTAQNSICEQCYDEETSRVWNTIDDSAQTALGQLHDIIDLLSKETGDNDETDDIQKNHGNFTEELEHTITACEQKLHSANIYGDRFIHGEHPSASANTEALLSFITEVYNNILKYSDPTDCYHINISFTSTTCTIVQTNTVSENLTLHHSKKGLRFHRERITALGGCINTTNENSQWTLFAEIPL